MSIKTLSASNRYLKKATAIENLVTNASSNTAIETGKGRHTYAVRPIPDQCDVEVKTQVSSKK